MTWLTIVTTAFLYNAFFCPLRASFRRAYFHGSDHHATNSCTTPSNSADETITSLSGYNINDVKNRLNTSSSNHLTSSANNSDNNYVSHNDNNLFLTDIYFTGGNSPALFNGTRSMSKLMDIISRRLTDEALQQEAATTRTHDKVVDGWSSHDDYYGTSVTADYIMTMGLNKTQYQSDSTSLLTPGGDHGTINDNLMCNDVSEVNSEHIEHDSEDFVEGYETDDNRIYWWACDYICDVVYLFDIIFVRWRLKFVRDGIVQV